MDRLRRIPSKGEVVVWTPFLGATRTYQVVGWSPSQHAVVANWLPRRKRTFLYVREDIWEFEPTGMVSAPLYPAAQ